MSGTWQGSVARILAPNGGTVGTGALVQCPQYGQVVLTAAHVVNAVFAPERGEYSADRPAPSVQVPFDLPLSGSGGRHTGEVIEWAPPRPPNLRTTSVTDVALLAALSDERAALRATTRVLRPDDFEVLADDDLKGREVQCYGFPDRAGQGRYAFGTIQGAGVGGLLHLVANDDRGHFIEPGFSGAPLFDVRGQKVLGMAVAMDAEQARRLAFAVPTSLLWRACPELARPYRGLKVFEEEDAAFFFGRESFVAALLAKAATHPIVGVTAASGAGKSSAIRAGLLPRIRSEHTAVVLVMRPYNDPWRQLAEALVPHLFPDAQPGERSGHIRQKVKELRESPSILCDDARTILEEARATRLVIFVDQFEELFTAGDASVLAGDAVERVDFRDLMIATADLGGQAGTPKLQWLYALRGDFADRAFRHPGFRDKVGDGNEFLADMLPKELEDAIRKPATALGVEFEGGTETQPGLVGRIARDAGADAGATVGSLPLMQHVLEDLWESMRERRLTHKAYEGLGELTGALDRHAGAIFSALTAEHQQLVPRLFSRLVNLREDGQATRRVASRQELEEADPALWTLAVQLATEVKRANQEPARSRLLAVGGEAKARISGMGGTASAPGALMEAAAEGSELADGGWVEVAHEALLKYWSRLHDWITDQRDFLLWRNKLDRRIAELDEYHKSTPRDFDDIPSEYLLRGIHLTEAERFWETRRNDLDKKQAAFVETSRKAAEIEEQRLAEERRNKEELEHLRLQLQKMGIPLEPLERRIFDFQTIESYPTEAVKTRASNTMPGHLSVPHWAIEAIGAHLTPFTGSGVTIGCIDTGIDVSHPAFAGLDIVQKTFGTTNEINDDLNHHGTAMASLILGRTMDGKRVGIAPGIQKLVVAKVTGGFSDSLLQALLWLHDSGVDIIHIGFGFDFIGYGDSLIRSGVGNQQAFARTLHTHLEQVRLFEAVMNLLYMRDRPTAGTLIFAPAGNESNVDNRVPVTSPFAIAKGVISVGAVGRVDRGLEAAAFTNLGPTICAPGVDVQVARPGGGFGMMSGTTLSCAIAVGTAALWWESVRARGGSSSVDARDVAALMLGAAVKDGFVPGTNQELLGQGLIKAPTGSNDVSSMNRDGDDPRENGVVRVVPVVPITSR